MEKGWRRKEKKKNADGGGGKGACNSVAVLGEEMGRGLPEIGVVRILEKQSLTN